MYGILKIFSGRSNPQLAKEICDYLGVPLEGVDIIDFPNENVFTRLHASVRGQDVFVVQTATSPVNRNIIELLVLLDTLKRASADRITAVVPFFPYARSDKKDQPRVPITARLMADIITVAGADRYMTIDLHAGQIQGFFSTPGDELTAFHLLSDYFLEKKLSNAVIVSADLGFAKKARNFAQKLHLPLAFVEKRRLANVPESEALTLIGEVEGCDAILVDDEVLEGTTLVHAAELLKKHGARYIYASFTHPAFAPGATERLREAPFVEVVTTNTVAIPEDMMLPNITVLSVAPLLGEVIRRVHEGRSVGELFNE